MATMGERIRRLRLEKGLSAEGLGEKVGATQVYITNIENGFRTPGSDLTVRLAEFFGVTTDFILLGKGA